MSTQNYGSQSMVAPLRRVLVRRPDSSVAGADPQRWHYVARIDFPEALREHDAFVQLLRDAGAEILFHDAALPDHADAQFTHDPSLVCDRGAILLKMGKPLRIGEEDAQGESFAHYGVPIHARLQGEAQGEGGDMLWLDEHTLLVGIGFRTNMAAVEQLRAALPGVDVLPFDMPYDLGRAACLHIMSFISLLDRDLAVVHLPLMPVRLFELLRARGVQLVEVPAHEYVSMATNVLAVGPRDCIMLQGNPITRARLEAAGCQVRTYKGDEISLKAEGGATCLTRPVWRSY